jgi:hypothetical protein
VALTEEDSSSVGEDSPSPGEAVWRLARFIDEVRVVRPPPLICSPPKQKTLPMRTLSLRSRRIATQQMDHIPASKRDEVLLMKKMGFLEPSAPPSSAAKCSYESYFKGDLLAADVEALDELFLACKGVRI